MCAFKPTTRLYEWGAFAGGLSLVLSSLSSAFALLLLLAAEKERKKKLVPNTQKSDFCESFFPEEDSAHTHTHKKKKKLSLPCRFVFRPSGRSPNFILSHEFNSDACRLLCVAMRERDFAQFKAIFQTKKCGTKERRVSLTRARAHTLFKFFFCLQRFERTIIARAFTRTLRGKSEETLEICCTFCARAQELVWEKI